MGFVDNNAKKTDQGRITHSDLVRTPDGRISSGSSSQHLRDEYVRRALEKMFEVVNLADADAHGQNLSCIDLARGDGAGVAERAISIIKKSVM